ncbi:hypothetical protein U1Q18_027823 [Sarracenia purpurea var. burkii]
MLPNRSGGFARGERRHSAAQRWCWIEHRRMATTSIAPGDVEPRRMRREGHRDGADQASRSIDRFADRSIRRGRSWCKSGADDGHKIPKISRQTLNPSLKIFTIASTEIWFGDWDICERERERDVEEHGESGGSQR